MTDIRHGHGVDGASKAEEWDLYDYSGSECDASVCGLTKDIMAQCDSKDVI